MRAVLRLNDASWRTTRNTSASPCAELAPQQARFLRQRDVHARRVDAGARRQVPHQPGLAVPADRDLAVRLDRRRRALVQCERRRELRERRLDLVEHRVRRIRAVRPAEEHQPRAAARERRRRTASGAGSRRTRRSSGCGGTATWVTVSPRSLGRGRAGRKRKRQVVALLSWWLSGLKRNQNSKASTFRRGGEGQVVRLLSCWLLGLEGNQNPKASTFRRGARARSAKSGAVVRLCARPRESISVSGA